MAKTSAKTITTAHVSAKTTAKGAAKHTATKTAPPAKATTKGAAHVAPKAAAKTATTAKAIAKPAAKSAAPAKAIAKAAAKSATTAKLVAKPAAATAAAAPPVKRGAIDPNVAKAAYDRNKKRYAAIPIELIETTNVPLDGAVTAARALVRSTKPVAAKLASLPADLFDPTAVTRLDDDALALFFAHGKANGDRAKQSRAKLPPDLVTKATAQRQRMMRLVTYHFDDDATLGPEIARIRVGTGYADLAHDLSDLADIYDEELDEVKQDPKYVAGDETTARALSMEILDTLGLGTKSGWTGVEARILTSLKSGYEDVAATLTWIGRKDPEPVVIPSLTMASDPERNAKIRHGMTKPPAPTPPKSPAASSPAS
jgi:hypothetical protein